MKRVLLWVVLTLLAAWTCAASDVQPPTLALGASAPDFTLPGVDGNLHTLNEFSNARLLLVIFTCNHCPTAQYYEERIRKLAADYTNKSVAIVAIMPNDPKSIRLDELGWTDLSDSFEEMKLRAKDRNYNFPYLYDGDNEKVSRSYGPVATPHAFIFDAARKLRYVGALDDSERIQHVTRHYAREALDALLAGKEPGTNHTRVVGCSVKWAGKEDAVKNYLAKLSAEPVGIMPVEADALLTLRKNGSGKFRLINFWATWCAPCVAEFSELVTINRMYRHRDFELITVSINRPDEEDSVLAFLKKKEASGLNLIFASADRERLMDAFDPNWQGAVPYTVLIAPDGRTLYHESGSIDPLALKRAIVGAMNQVKPW